MDKTIINDNMSEQLSDYIEKLASTSPYFQGILYSIRRGETEVSFIRQEVNKHIQLEWIEAIEMVLVALDNAIRTPSRYIEERDEVKPIELSHSIRPRSLIHLAQHTNYISEIDKDNNITPNRILNVYNEETLLTYENRFVNTLVHRLYTFVNTRYTEMVSKGMENGSVLSIKTAFKDEGFNGKVDLKISVAEALDNSESSGSNALKRAGQLNSVITSYINSEFIKSMGDNFVRPPIMRTNALLKNKDLKLCLDLWQFIEGYDKVGYTISVARKAQSPNDKLIDKLYDDLALQYVTFKNEISEDAENKPTIIDEDEIAIEPLVNAEFEEIDPRSLDLYQSEYRKIASVPIDKKEREKTEEDIKIQELVSKCISKERFYRGSFNEKLKRIKLAREKLLKINLYEEQQRILLERQRKLEEMEKTSVKDVAFQYDRSFKARLIQSDDQLKEYYGALKNKLLSYENTTPRISWHYEAINKGRNSIAKFRVSGKNLYLYLQIEPEKLDGTKFKVGYKKGKLFETTPCEFKINNNRRFKLALELIEIMCNDIQLEFEEIHHEDFYLPYQPTEELIEDELIIDLNAPKKPKPKVPKDFSTAIVARKLKKKPDFDDENGRGAGTIWDDNSGSSLGDDGRVQRH